MSTADRKKKNFSFSRKFPFMKSKDQIGSDEQLSTEERKLHIFSLIIVTLFNNVVIHVHRVILILRKNIYVLSVLCNILNTCNLSNTG